MINQELLRTFLAVAESATFADAARTRHVTKSAISQQIKALETQLGVPLFERVGRHAVLTESGQRLRTVLKREFQVIDEAVEALVADHHEIKGEVRIGAPRPFARVWLRPRLESLLRAHPRLGVRVVFGTPSELEPRLATGELDFALLVRAPSLPSIEAEHIYTERFRAYAAPEYVTRHGSPSTADELEKHRFLAFDDDLPMLTEWWRAQFGGRTPFRGEIACKVASLDEMLALAEAGMGIVVLPDYFAEASVLARSLVSVAGKREPKGARNDIFLAHRRHAIPSARFRAVHALLRR